MSEPLKLRVGGVYLNRRGERVEIVSSAGWDSYQFGAANGRYYTPDGHWSACADTAFDLVSEVTKAPPALPPADDDLRTRAALAAMTGILASGVWVDWSERSVADAALRHADALIAALKEAHDGTQ